MCVCDVVENFLSKKVNSHLNDLLNILLYESLSLAVTRRT